MIRIEFIPEGLKKTKPHEHVLRFVFGGLVTVATGVVAHEWGPAIGGLFLAFPAIVPASLTLVKSHDGRSDAIDDARGARLGALALCAFAIVVWGLCRRISPGLALTAALLAWALVGTLIWWIVCGARSGARRVAREPRDAPVSSIGKRPRDVPH